MDNKEIALQLTVAYLRYNADISNQELDLSTDTDDLVGINKNEKLGSLIASVYNSILKNL
ncbi:hypothetical protein AGMMS49975_29230 [Clostridia bacterium]|nr:hypothetical protein AGMMS49975_29230 [Clostridia bacterium]